MNSRKRAVPSVAQDQLSAAAFAEANACGSQREATAAIGEAHGRSESRVFNTDDRRSAEQFSLNKDQQNEPEVQAKRP